MSKTDEKYWAEYTGLQHAKHQILSKYLDGWFPILARFHGRVIYIDCHAGRGRHDTGQEGSPIIALERLLTHQSRPEILDSTEIHFVFFENNPESYGLLHEEIDNLGKIPKNVRVLTFQDDYEAALRETVNNLRQRGTSLAPSFVFVDPYGFKLSMHLLNSMLRFRGCELLINFMYRYIDMAITRPEHTSNMDALFGCHDWHELSSINNSEDRQIEIIALFSRQLQAEYVTHMNMIGAKNERKYVLLHASNHPKGRNLMKDSMWAVSPDGSFTAYERDNPNQQVLLELKPNLEPLKKMLWRKFAGQEVRLKHVDNWSLITSYREKHVHDIIRNYQKRDIICASDKFGVKKKDLLISFPSKRPEGS